LKTLEAPPARPATSGYRALRARRDGIVGHLSRARTCKLGDIEALLLAHDASLASALVEATRSRIRDESISFTVEVFVGTWAPRVREERRARGPSPIGVCVPNDAIALEALAAGADEAMVITPVTGDPSAVLAFVDRTLLRASLRHEDERRRESLRHAERLTALGAVVAGVAHEINNPLCSILLGLDMVDLFVQPLLAGAAAARQLARDKRPLTTDQVRELARRFTIDGGPSDGVSTTLAEIGEAVSAVTSVVRDLKIFARPDQGERPEVVDVRDLVDQVLRLVRKQIEDPAVLERDLGEDLPSLLVPPTRVAQVLTNLLINAAQAVREVERPMHRIRISTRADEEAVAIIVTDTGPGIPPSDVERIFDPFYSTRRQDMGTGLGLSISRSILRELGGDLMVESVHGEGATFLALLPRPTPEELRDRTMAEPRTPSPAGRRRLSLLIVDDDERMLRAYVRALGMEHDVVTASDGREAIELLSSGTVADVIVSEVGMPDVDGPQLYLWLLAQRPELAPRTLFVTAFDSPCEVLEEARRPVLGKPVDRLRLLEEIDRLADDQAAPVTPS
jgi:two-component system NtrC family sensor kinase